MSENNPIIDCIIRYFNENEEVFISVIEELDNYTFFLGDSRFYETDELLEALHDTCEISSVRRLVYDLVNGEDECDNVFDPYSLYYRYDNGVLTSYESKDYHEFLDAYFISELADAYEDMFTIHDDEELDGLFRELLSK